MVLGFISLTMDLSTRKPDLLIISVGIPVDPGETWWACPGRTSPQTVLYPKRLNTDASLVLIFWREPQSPNVSISPHHKPSTPFQCLLVCPSLSSLPHLQLSSLMGRVTWFSGHEHDINVLGHDLGFHGSALQLTFTSTMTAPSMLFILQKASPHPIMA